MVVHVWCCCCVDLLNLVVIYRCDALVALALFGLLDWFASLSWVFCVPTGGCFLYVFALVFFVVFKIILMILLVCLAYCLCFAGWWICRYCLVCYRLVICVFRDVLT